MPLAYAQKALALHNCARVWCPWVHAKCVRTARTFARLPRLTSTCTRATQGSEICPEHSRESIRHVCGCLAGYAVWMCAYVGVSTGSTILNEHAWLENTWRYFSTNGSGSDWKALRKNFSSRLPCQGFGWDSDYAVALGWGAVEALFRIVMALGFRSN